MADQGALPVIRLDPTRVNEVDIAAGRDDLIIVFKRMVLLQHPDGLHGEMIPGGAVSLPWSIVRRLRDVLSERLAAHDAADQAKALDAAVAAAEPPN